MKDLGDSLRSMSERGMPIGSRRLRDRVALELAGARLAPERACRWRLSGPAVAVFAAAVFLVAFGGLVMLLNWHKDDAATPTTVVSTTLPVASTTTMTPSTTTPTTSTTAPATITTVAVVPPVATTLEATPAGLLMAWEKVPVADGRLVSVVDGGPGLVAVGLVSDGYHGDAAVWVSSDGRAWTRVPDEGNVFGGEGEGLEDGDQWMADISAWQGGFVAVGSDGRGQNAEYDAAVWLSEDGVTWARVPDQESLGGPGAAEWMNAVTAGGPGLVAVGEVSEPMTSTDVHPVVWLSPDGLTWTRLDPVAIEGGGTDPGEGSCTGRDAVMTDVAVGGPGLIAVGMVDPYCRHANYVGGDPAVWVSAEGSLWGQTLLDPGVSGTTNLVSVRSVVAGPGGIVAVGGVGDLAATDGGLGVGHRYGAVWMSEDGIDWRLAAVLDHGALEDTPDSRYGAYAGDALWDGDTLVVVGEASTRYGDHPGYGLVWASLDLGQNWYLLTMEQAAFGVPLGGITWGPGAALGDSAVMSHAVPFGSGVVVVGTGVTWLGEWQAE